MNKINITQAREKLPEIMNEVYFNLRTFIITRRGIPMVKITKIDEKEVRERVSEKERKKAIREAARIWKNRWKGKTTEEVVSMLREKAWHSHAS